jgi:hypothetical protein
MTPNQPLQPTAAEPEKKRGHRTYSPGEASAKRSPFLLGCELGPPARVVERAYPPFSERSDVRKVRSILFALVVALALPPIARGEPAAISDVRHEPGTPKPGVTVLVTARLAKGLTRPVLRL